MRFITHTGYGLTSRRVSSPHLQGENLRVSLWFVCQSKQGGAYKLSTKDFGILLSTARVEKVAMYISHYAVRVTGFEPAYEGVKTFRLTT